MNVPEDCKGCKYHRDGKCWHPLPDLWAELVFTGELEDCPGRDEGGKGMPDFEGR